MTFPSFSVGEVLTAADMNAVGLWRVTNCTVTSVGGTAATASNGVITIGSGNTSVTVNNAFSADFDNYLIIISSGATSATCTLQMTLGSTTTGYYYAGKGRTYAGVDVNNENNNAFGFWYAAEGNVNSLSGTINVGSPFLSKNTTFNTQIEATRTDGYSLRVGGYIANTTSYTSFKLTPNTGSFSSGTIRVYGYRN